MLTLRNKKSLKQPNSTPQGTGKRRTNEAQSWWKEGTKIRAEINEIKTEKNRKDQ